MNSFQIHYFLETCKVMNFSKASTMLNITQQGLSKAIKALEDELGVELFERNGNKLILTKYGELVKSELQEIEDRITTLEIEVERMKREEKNLISVGILEGFFNDNAFDLTKWLGIPAEFKDIVFYKCSKEMCENNCPLQKQVVDMCITKSPVDMRKFEICYSVAEPFFAVVPRSNPLAARDMLTIGDLVDEQLIILNKQYKFYGNFINRCQNAGFEPKIHHTVGEISAVFLPCVRGDGIGIIPEFAVQKGSFPSIRIIPFSEDVSEELCFLIGKNKTPTHPVQNLIDTIRDMGQR